MLGQLGFSYIGLTFLLMLIVPNLIWMKKMPQGYMAEGENKVLVVFEKAEQIVTSCCVLLFLLLIFL